MEDLEQFLKCNSDVIDIGLLALAVVVSSIALFVAYRIPRLIMARQIYADLTKEYRSAEMGAAILAIFHFYTWDCENNVNAIADKYKEKYEEQIEGPLKRNESINYADTLHFQRRLVAQFYADMANLCYEERPSTKQMRKWLTPNEKTLRAIILHMAKPAAAVFEKPQNVFEPLDMEDDAPMNKSILRLYEEVKIWE